MSGAEYYGWMSSTDWYLSICSPLSGILLRGHNIRACGGDWEKSGANDLWDVSLPRPCSVGHSLLPCLQLPTSYSCSHRLKCPQPWTNVNLSSWAVLAKCFVCSNTTVTITDYTLIYVHEEDRECAPSKVFQQLIQGTGWGCSDNHEESTDLNENEPHLQIFLIFRNVTLNCQGMWLMLMYYSTSFQRKGEGNAIGRVMWIWEL